MRQKFARIRDNYKELHLDMDGGYAVTFQGLSNEGAGIPARNISCRNWRLRYSNGEEMNLKFPSNDVVYYPEEESFFSHNERKYLPRHLAEIEPAFIATLPAVVDVGDGAKVAIAESDLEEYPGLWLRAPSGKRIVRDLSSVPTGSEKLERDRDVRVVESADYIAVTKGTRAFPWRIIGVAEKDGDLLTNQLTWLLAKPSQVQDTSWIKPGKVAWDWWNAWNVYGVDFKAGVNTQTYKYYIDFASKYGIPYIILDEGWYKLGNVLDVVPDVNMEELSAYAKEKNVRIILWVIWNTLDDQLEKALDQYAKWGNRRNQGGFHAAQRSEADRVLSPCESRDGQAGRCWWIFTVDQKAGDDDVRATYPNLISTEGKACAVWNGASGARKPIPIMM